MPELRGILPRLARVAQQGTSAEGQCVESVCRTHVVLIFALRFTQLREQLRKTSSFVLDLGIVFGFDDLKAAWLVNQFDGVRDVICIWHEHEKFNFVGVKSRLKSGEDISVKVWHLFGQVRLTEGFYDTALNEMSNVLKYRELYQRQPASTKLEGVPNAPA